MESPNLIGFLVTLRKQTTQYAMGMDTVRTIHWSNYVQKHTVPKVGTQISTLTITNNLNPNTY